MKKAQGISISTIIIAALALIVLVVLIAIFTGRMGIFGTELSQVQKGVECPGLMRQGSCQEGEQSFYGNLLQCKKEQTPEFNKCYSQGWSCCIGVKK